MASAVELAGRLSEASVRKQWDVYTAFDWPEHLESDAHWYMSPELISIHGTETWDALSETAQKRLSFYEIVNFFSFVLLGERPLIEGMTHRMYRKATLGPVTDYLHHFVAEENKHMIMFGTFCSRYAAVYPEKKLVLPREYAKGEEDIAFFCKVLIVEELGDYYNLKMMGDARIHPLVAKINKVHHIDEARHLAFGREFLREIAEKHLGKWSDDERAAFQKWLVEYLRSSWGDFYNPAVYRDAGLPDGYAVRKMALEHPACRKLREAVSEKLVAYFLEIGLLGEAPPL